MYITIPEELESLPILVGAGAAWTRSRGRPQGTMGHGGGVASDQKTCMHSIPISGTMWRIMIKKAPKSAMKSKNCQGFIMSAYYEYNGRSSKKLF